MADVAVDRIRAIVGYADATVGASITFTTFNNKPVTFTCSGGSPSVSSLKPQGTGIGAVVPGLDHVCHTGLATVSGLSAGTKYTWTLAHEGEVIEGSFRTAPDLLNIDYAVLATTCENDAFRVQPTPYAGLRKLFESYSPTIYLHAHIDDLGYFDSLRLSFLSMHAACPETTLTQSDVPQNGEKRYDYDVAWCGWMGMLPAFARQFDDPNRQWCFRNMCHAMQGGDHERYGNAHREVADGPAARGVLQAVDAFANELFTDYIMAASPPKLRAGELYWGMAWPHLRMFSADAFTHARPYNSHNVGNTFSYGAGDYAVTLDGTEAAPDPTIDEINTIFSESHPDNAAIEETLGDQQITDIHNYITGAGADEAFKWFLSPISMAGDHQPYSGETPNEFSDLWLPIYQSARCNGTDGHIFCTVGDLHAAFVEDLVADGTANGFLGTSLSSGSLWDFSLCTINGSGMGKAFQKTSLQGRVQRHSKGRRQTLGDTAFATGVIVEVLGSRDPVRLRVLHSDLSYGLPLKTHWPPYYLDANAIDNVFMSEQPSVAVGF